MITTLAICLYGLVGLVWIFWIVMPHQRELSDSKLLLVLSMVVNFFLWPAALIMAIVTDRLKDG